MSAAIKPTSIEETQLPNSRRVYIDGKQPGVRVPFREISQNQTRNFDNTLEDNAPVRVYSHPGKVIAPRAAFLVDGWGTRRPSCVTRFADRLPWLPP